jgi:alkylation response protein AidB-like acyl-CoA dehydrogenase
MAVEVEPARGLYWYAAYAQDIEADDRRRMAVLSKAHLGDIFMQTSRNAIEAHGGIGFTWEFDAQIWFKRAMFDFAYLGAPSVQRDRAAELGGWEC